jgi:putative ABC transport system permease protein
MRDLTRQTLRSLRRSPLFSTMAVLTFALGIGASTAIYSVVSRVLVRPLDLPEADRLVTVWTSMPAAGITQLAVAHAEYLDYRAETSLLEEAGAYAILSGTLTGVGDPLKLNVVGTTASLWTVLRLPPALGRTFIEGDDIAGAEPVALLSHALWQGRFGGDASVVGRTITLDGRPRRVVGVMPPAVDFTRYAPDLWVPYVLDATRRDNHHLLVVGRMKPTTSVEMLQPEMDAIVAGWAQRYTHHHPMFALPLRDVLIGDVRTPLSILLAASLLVLLISAANVAGLQLARGEARVRELAVHAALGAGRWRIARRLLVENLALAAAGGLLGVALAKVALLAILSGGAAGLPAVGAIVLDLPVLAFAFGLSLLAGIAAGAFPAWRVSRPDLAIVLKGSGERTASGSTRQRLRSGLVIAQTALAVVLVASAALLVRGLVRMTALDAGVDPDHVLAAQITLPPASYPGPEEVVAFYDRLLERLAALPGVRSAALVNSLPMRTGERWILVGGPWQPPESEPVGTQLMTVSPDYFSTLGTRVVRGRPFTAADRTGAARVAAVNQSAARAFFGEGDALGRTLSIVQAKPSDPGFEVVAVVEDALSRGPAVEASLQVYLPLALAVTDIRGVTRDVNVALKTFIEPAELAGALRTAIWELDPALAVAGIETMESLAVATLGPQRFQTTLLSSYAALALVLAAVGLYGLLAHSVGLRRREMGIRLALGADSRRLLALVLRQGLALTSLGLVAGFIASLASGRLVGRLVQGLGANDPACLAITALVLLATAALASYLPARRASLLDPARTIREE